jgi:hypothetical protein
MKNPWVGVGLAIAIFVTAILLKRLSVGYYLVLGVLVVLAFVYPPAAILLGAFAFGWILFTQFHPMGKSLNKKTGGWL